MSGISTKNLPLSQNVAEVVGNDSEGGTVRISRAALARLVGYGLAEQITNAGGMAIFPDTTAGLAATTDGDYFSVPSDDSDEYLILYRNDNGSAEEVRRYPSAEAVDHALDYTEQTTRVAVDLASEPGMLPAEFSGDEGLAFAFTDENGRVAAGLTHDGAWVSRGPGEPADAMYEPPARIAEEFATDAPLVFAFTDDNGQIIAGFDRDGDFRTPERREFPADDDPAFALVDEQGRVLLGLDHEGNLIAQGMGGNIAKPQPLLGYVEGGALYGVGAAEEALADLGGYAAEAVAPGNEMSVRAVIDRPMIGSRRSVSVGTSGLLIPDSDKVLHIVIGLGQSLMVGSNGTDTLIHTTPTYPDMVMMPDVGSLSDVRLGLAIYWDQPHPVFDPDDFTGFRPLVARISPNPILGETPMEAFANALEREADSIGVKHRFLMFTTAWGSANYDALKKGSQPYSNMLSAVTKAKALAEAEGWRVVVDACVVRHGEADRNNPTYGDDLIEWQQDVSADLQGITGQQAPVHFLLAQPSSFDGDNTQSVQAMIEVHESSPFHHVVGADYSYADLYAPDLLHGTAAFYVLSGEYLARAYRQAIWTSGEKSKVTRIIGAVRTGTTVTLSYEVPEPPLVVDESVPEADARGYRYTDSNGSVPISAVAVIDSGVGSGVAEVELTLGATPSGSGETVHYAMSGHASASNREEATIPRGQIRDSAPDTSTYDGRPLYNWGVHQRVPVTVN